MIFILRPCVIESREHCLKMAAEIKEVVESFGADWYFKASYDKANRTSLKGFRGIGQREGFDTLCEVKERLDIKTTTDGHALIFVSVVTASVVRARRIAATDYSSPVGAFLREAERRCAFVNWRAIGLFLPFFIIATLTAGLGWLNAFERYFPHLGESTGLVAFSILWACNCLIAAAAGTIWWKKKRKPLFDEIKRFGGNLPQRSSSAGCSGNCTRRG